MNSDERSLIDLLREAADLDGRVQRKPYLMVAGALGAGFVLGGGLFTRLCERIAGAALRVAMLAAAPLLEDEIGRHLGGTANQADSQARKGESS
jgi:hypothetical protein